ncbi:hypothetical protein T484DRAFT_1913431 [Baffinella frigidus]|nr:hypothetical protein T484DRAFT_1913431 [Cryptophyta sp. CCMP2293]
MAPDPIKAPTQEIDTGLDFERLNRFEPLNDTTGRPKRVFRKTPPPPSIRRQSTSKTTEGAQFKDDICSSARLDRFEPLNAMTDRPKRVVRKTPPPPTLHGVYTSASHDDLLDEHNLEPVSGDFISAVVRAVEVISADNGFRPQHPPASHDEFLARRRAQHPPRVSSPEAKLTSSFLPANKLVPPRSSL